MVSGGQNGLSAILPAVLSMFSSDRRNALYRLFLGFTVVTAVDEVDHQVHGNDRQIEDVHGENVVDGSGKDLCGDACNISGHNQQNERGAHPLRAVCLDVLHDGEGRRVAILGDMGELGENEIALHEEVGTHAAQCGIDVCICVGALSVHMAEAARKADQEFKVIYEESRESLLEHLGDLVQEGDTILVKASHFMQFEEVVKALEEM